MTIKIKEKQCKGTGLAAGFGCGKLTYHRIYGLGKMCCYTHWLLNSENGKIKLDKAQLTSSKLIQKENRINKSKEKKQRKLELISTDKYRSEYLQPVINKIARLIDYQQPCIATGNFGKMSGGHYISVGANRTICLNLHNIFVQSFQSNNWKSGDTVNYQKGLIQTFGNDYFEFVDSLRQHKVIKLSKKEMILIRSKALKICNRIERNKKVNNPLERIKLRNEVNLELNIYDLKFSQFKKLK